MRWLPALRRRCDIAGKRLSGTGLAAEGRVLRAVLYVYHHRLLRHRPYLALQQVRSSPGWPAGSRQLVAAPRPPVSSPRKAFGVALDARSIAQKAVWSRCLFVGFKPPHSSVRWVSWHCAARAICAFQPQGANTQSLLRKLRPAVGIIPYL